MNKDKVVAENINLVRSIAAKYKKMGVPLEDLVQEGLIGLLKATENFDENKGAKFSTYASYWIKKYILSALDKETRTSLNTSPLNEEITQDTDSIPTSHRLNLPQNMPADEKSVITLLFQSELTLKEIARKIGISRERVRQLKEKGLRRIRAKQK